MHIIHLELYLRNTWYVLHYYIDNFCINYLQVIGGKMGKSEGLGDGSKRVDFGNYTVWVGLTQKCLFQGY